PRWGGLGIGLTVATLILLGGPITGAAMNPARVVGPSLVSGYLFTPTGALEQIVYWIGPLLGAIIASLIAERLLAPAKAAS
ncbi:MAG: aquaporin, partial [Dehalococcoidia bacterium]|nr:aquaporin [Dehalococcoidia bacterium]